MGAAVSYGPKKHWQAGRRAGKQARVWEETRRGKTEKEENVEDGKRWQNEGGKTATRGRIGVKDRRRREGKRPKRKMAENGLEVK